VVSRRGLLHDATRGYAVSVIALFWPESVSGEEPNGSRSCDGGSVSVSGSRDDPVGHARKHRGWRQDSARVRPRITKAAQDLPDGLLSHETFLWSLFPPHAGVRQYWRDFAALETWSRSEPHRAWWKSFLRDSGGTGFWHETYFLRGGVEAVFDDIPTPIGLMRFAPRRIAKGSMFTARQRAAATNAAGFADQRAPAPVVTEGDLGRLPEL